MSGTLLMGAWTAATRRACVIALALPVLCAPASGRARAGQPVSTDTDKGVVVGQLQGGDVAAFLGIPYAAPPVGDLRFRPPQPHAAWSAPLEASGTGSPCPQTARLGSPSTNEDCLYLNVWTVPYGRNRPVLVFLHGGSFNAGQGGATLGTPGAAGPSYDGARIVQLSGAIVVTLNYRLGVLGFLAAPALDAESPRGVSGNYGLQDQAAALAWVRRNIAGFGGDPNNVTLFGQSAGGISVLYQMVSPAASGLFQRAIIESADDGASLGLTEAEALEAPVVAGLGCAGAGESGADIAACLRALPVQTILNSGASLGPLIDGATVPSQPLGAFAAGQFNRVPVIAGTTADEGTYFLTVAEQSVGRALTPGDATAILAGAYGANAGAVAAQYPLAGYTSPGAALAAVQTDSFFACPTDHVRTVLSARVPVYAYEFAQPNPVADFPLPLAPVMPPDIPLLDSHTSELAYVFGHDGNNRRLNGPDRALSNQIIAFWTGFAGSGSPDAGLGDFFLVGARHWPHYTQAAPQVIALQEPVGRAPGFAQLHRCAFWASIGYPEVLLEGAP